MPDKVTTVGSVEKVATFSAKGGGVTITVQMPDDPDKAAVIMANRQKIADITFAFRATAKSSINEDKGQGKLLDEDGVEVKPDDKEPMGGKGKGKK